MRHSAGAWSGKTSEVPTFRVEPLAETVSQNFVSERDTLSASRLFGKCIPVRASIPGCSFR